MNDDTELFSCLVKVKFFYFVGGVVVPTITDRYVWTIFEHSSKLPIKDKFGKALYPITQLSEWQDQS